MSLSGYERERNNGRHLQGSILCFYFLGITFLLSISVSNAFLFSSPLHTSCTSCPSVTTTSSNRLLFAASTTSPPPTPVKASSDTNEEVDSKWCEEYAEHLDSLKSMSKKNEQKWIDNLKSLSHDELTLYRRKANARRKFIESESASDESDFSDSEPEKEEEKLKSVLEKVKTDETVLESVSNKLKDFSTEVSETTVDGIALDGKIQVSFNLEREPVKVTIDPDMDLTNMDAESLSLLIEQAMDNGHKKASMEFEKKWRNFKIKDSEMGNLNFDQMLGELV